MSDGIGISLEGQDILSELISYVDNWQRWGISNKFIEFQGEFPKQHRNITFF